MPRSRSMQLLLTALLALALAACGGGSEATPTASPAPASTAAPTLTATLRPASTSTPQPPAPTSPPATGRAQVVSRGPEGRNAVALTFDAGADTGFAGTILDILRNEGVSASFGMTGRWAEANPALLRRIVDEGHELINHTYDHTSFTGLSTGSAPLSRDERWAELDRTEEIVLGVGGASSKPYFRPPFGDYDDSVLDDVGARGYAYSVMWTVDSRGWQGRSADEIVEICLSGAAPGAIYIFHVGSESQDAAALPRVIASLRDQGYAFVTISELLGH
ncbi:MAG: polysaccharide deacetylase family protein [Dehalococcoidia bacterium]